MAHNSLCVFFSLQSTTLSILHTVNNVEVTVNTCTCIDVFTAKDQSGGIYNRWPGIYCYSKQTLSLGYALRLSLFTAINHLCYNYYKSGLFLDVSYTVFDELPFQV